LHLVSHRLSDLSINRFTHHCLGKLPWALAVPAKGLRSSTDTRRACQLLVCRQWSALGHYYEVHHYSNSARWTILTTSAVPSFVACLVFCKHTHSLHLHKAKATILSRHRLVVSSLRSATWHHLKRTPASSMVANWPNLFQTDMQTTEKHRDGDKEHKRRVSKSGCKCSSRQQQQSQLARSPLGLGVVVATSLYCGVKAGIQVRWPGRRVAG
jgi:hypothetical protein